MTKSIIIAHSHPLLKYGGGEVAAYRQFEYLRSLGHDVAYVGATLGWAEAQHLMGPDQRVIDLGDNDYLIRTFGMDGFYMEQADAEFEDWLVDFLCRLDGDVYHFHHFWNIGVSTIRRLRERLPGKKFICTLHELTAICANHGQMVKARSLQLCMKSGPLLCASCLGDRAPLDFKLRQRRLANMLDQFDQLISPSHFLADRFATWGVERSRIAVIENGLPFGRAPDDTRNATLSKLSRRFAFFGQATPTKGLDVLVRAANILEDEGNSQIEIEVLGATLEDFTNIWPDMKLPEGMRFRGRYRPEDVISIMGQYGWIIMPSTWWENSPVIIQEAKAAGTPMIVSNIGGMAEKTEGWGVPFEVGNATDLASTLSKLNGDANALKRAIRAIPDVYSMEDFYAAWKELAL